MKFNDIKDLSVAELSKKKSGLQKSLFEAQMKNSIGQLSNPLEIRALRKNVARLNTALTTKKAAPAKKTAASKKK